MQLKKLIFGLLISMTIVSCSKEDIGEKISYEIIYDSYLSFSDENKIPKQIKVFKNENEWNNFILEIERLNPHGAEILKNINFDFLNNNLIIVIGEYYLTCCSEITINDIYSKHGKITVDYDESGPGELNAVSQAYLILKVKKDL